MRNVQELQHKEKSKVRNIKIISGLMLYVSMCALVHAQGPTAVYVSPNGTGSGYPGWEDAMSNIQDAVTLVAPGGTVWLSNGTWKLAARIEVGDHKTVRGYYGTNTPGMESIVSGDDKTGCFTLNSGVLDGLVITGGRADYAAGVWVKGGTVMCCRVEGNISTNSVSAANGGGAMLLAGACLVSNCTIIRNELQLTGAASQLGGSAVHFANTNAVVTDCVIRENVNRLNYLWANSTVFFYRGGTLKRSTIAWNTNYNATVCVVETYASTDNALISACNISSNDFPDVAAGNTASAVKLYGAGVLATNCTIDGNVNSRGVVMYNGARLLSSRIRNHQDVGHIGGGVRMSGENTLVADCIIENNSIAANAYAAAHGAGVAMGETSDAISCGTIINSIIRGNVNKQRDAGGGIGIRGTNAVVSNCIVVNNVKEVDANGGGGIVIRANATATITHSVISNNTSARQGGGILCNSGSKVNIRNCLIADNKSDSNGGGVCIYSNALIESCTIADNSVTGSGRGGGLFAYINDPQVINTIVYGNNAPVAGTSNWCYLVGGGTWSNNCTMPLAGSASDGNIAQDPQFTDPAAGQYQLQMASPCINTGVNQPTWMTDAMDLDARKRIDRFSGIVDMGCYEYIFRGSLLMLK